MLLGAQIFKGIKKYNIEVEHLKNAEKMLLREIQLEHYPPEMKALESKRALSNSSNILKLSPAIIDGLLGVQGRASNVSNVPQFTNNPIILDGKNYMSRLIISHYHALYNHSNDQTVINEIRQKYWITSLRTSLRSLKAHCPACQLLRARPSNPRMADLPPGRLALNENPFTHCGVDYFGPLQVTIGRRKEKGGACFLHA